MAITNGYTTGSAVKEALGIIDASSDTEIDLVIETVSRMIDDYAGRFFYSAGTVVSFYTPDKALSLEIDDVSSVSILQTDDGGDDPHAGFGPAQHFPFAGVDQIGIASRQSVVEQRPEATLHCAALISACSRRNVERSALTSNTRIPSCGSSRALRRSSTSICRESTW